MAEIKNSFLRSKMNKDLDDRLIPNGEYRDAQNISVGKSEADDIGALETVLGNQLVPGTDLGNSNLKVIGYYSDETNERLIVFLTDYTDVYPSGQPVYAPSTSSCFIYSYFKNDSGVWDYIPLVKGHFLNFSTSDLITGISLIEDLLFFTDYRNQPRKINIQSANPLLSQNPTYYKNEIDISVAKYNPYEPINLLSKVVKQTTTTGTGSVLAISDTTGIKVGMTVVDYTNIQAVDYVHVITVTANTSVELNASVTTSSAVDLYFLSSTMTGESISLNFNDGNSWPGDPDYLENKFVRLSYRFRFDDGEYSIMAPFTQVAFIPKQKGYFLQGDEIKAYRSTILDLMENGVQNISLLIPFPDTLNNVNTSATADYKIQAIDILYKESDGLAVRVLDTITTTDTEWTGDTDVLIYDYQSRKPFKTLPESQTVRVYDKVPVRAFAQETAGNRIIYGNFLNKYTPPEYLTYRVAVGPKNTTKNFDSWVEYPNHTVKQDRNYQVGFVLIDKFGRQSDVVLSNVDDTVNTIGPNTFGGSTIFNPYNIPSDAAAYPIRDWFGDSLKVQIDLGINSGDNGLPKIKGLFEGQPGLYANAIGSGFNIAGVAPSINGFPITIPNLGEPGFRYEFTLNGGSSGVPIIGSFLRGKYTDYVEVFDVVIVGADYQVFTKKPINKSFYSLTVPATTPDNKFAYKINQIGWYSYKIVVKQQEQDYYNVYLPGIVNGYYGHTQYFGDEIGKTAFSTLFGDNINKVPRDLSEVGPEQKQYRSSVTLSGRVENWDFSNVNPNRQYNPNTNTSTLTIKHSIDAIGPENEIVGNNSATTAHPSIYQGDTNPYLVRINTNDTAIGQLDSNSGSTDFPTLAIYETNPQESLLDIFWETQTAGLISDLNAAILSDFDGAIAWGPYNWNQLESLPEGDAFITGIYPIDKNGQPLVDTSIVPGSFNVFDKANPTNDLTSKFSFEKTGSGTSGDPFLYNFKTSATDGDFVFNETENIREFTLSAIVETAAGITSNSLSLSGNLTNFAPSIDTLTPINTDTSVVGDLRTLTGLNGSSSNVANENTQQLFWTIEAGNTLNTFSIGASSGILSKNSTSSPSGQFNLTIRLADANGNTANGSLYVEATQVVNVASLVVGSPFTASPPGSFNATCNGSGAQNAACSNGTLVTYYNNGGGTGGAVVNQNDEIRTGPNGTNSPLAASGVYAYNCVQQGPGNRRYFDINNSNGIVDIVSVC